jgi:hypothetical protein
MKLPTIRLLARITSDLPVNHPELSASVDESAFLCFHLDFCSRECKSRVMGKSILSAESERKGSSPRAWALWRCSLIRPTVGLGRPAPRRRAAETPAATLHNALLQGDAVEVPVVVGLGVGVDGGVGAGVQRLVVHLKGGPVGDVGVGFDSLGGELGQGLTVRQWDDVGA